MRDYVRGVYGVFKEDSNNLGIHLTLKVWRATLDEFDAAIDQLKADVAAAGGDWTGTLASKSYGWFKFGDGFMQTLLSTYWHGTSQASNAFDAAMNAQLVFESPRTEGYNSITEK